MNPGHILDSFALIAWLKGSEPSASTVNQILLAGGYVAISAINIGEVVYVLRKRFSQASANTFLERVPTLPVEVITPTLADILSAARLKSDYPISYADAFAAHLAISKNMRLVTGDPEFRAVKDLTCLWLPQD